MKKGLKLFTFGCVLMSAVGANVKADEAGITDGGLLETCVATSGNVCVLSKDIELVNTVTIAKDVVIDLAGHKITSSVATTFQLNAGKVVIKDSANNSESGIEVSGEAFRMGTKGNTSDSKDTTVLTIEKDVDVISTNDSCVVVYAGTLNTAGNIVSKDGEYATITGSGNPGNGGTVINITDGIVTHEKDVAVYHPQVGKLTISGGTVTGSTGVEIRSGDLIVTGGTIIGTDVPVDKKPNGNGSTTDGAGVAIAQHTTEEKINVSISGGTIKGYSALYESNVQGTIEENSTDIVIEITGGTFEAINGGKDAVYSEDVTGFVKGGKFSTDITKLADGTETKYLASYVVLTKVIDGVFSAGVEYPVVEGENQEVKVDAEKGITFKIDADYSLFDKLYIDGKEVPKQYYTVKSGSTIITLSADYAKTFLNNFKKKRFIENNIKNNNLMKERVFLLEEVFYFVEQISTLRLKK